MLRQVGSDTLHTKSLRNVKVHGQQNIQILPRALQSFNANNCVQLSHTRNIYFRFQALKAKCVFPCLIEDPALSTMKFYWLITANKHPVIVRNIVTRKFQLVSALWSNTPKSQFCFYCCSAFISKSPRNHIELFGLPQMHTKAIGRILVFDNWMSIALFHWNQPRWLPIVVKNLMEIADTQIWLSDVGNGSQIYSWFWFCWSSCWTWARGTSPDQQVLRSISRLLLIWTYFRNYEVEILLQCRIHLGLKGELIATTWELSIKKLNLSQQNTERSVLTSRQRTCF